MDFQVSDWVVHCTHGLGQVLSIEERGMDDNSALYHEVQIAGYSICVPADENLKNRLRFLIGEGKLRKLFPILPRKAGKLPDDRRECHLHLQEMLKDG